MYCTTPSGTRYQTGRPRATLARQSVEEMASAGTSTRLTRPAGSPVAVQVVPGPGHPDEVGQLEQLVDVAARTGSGPGRRRR